MVRRLPLALPALLLALPVAVSSALAQATPRSIGECERLKNDLAYNQCLAMFGPPARSVAGGDGSGGGPPPQEYAPNAAAAAGIPSPDDPELAEPNSRTRRGRYGRRNGRQSISFAVATAGDDVEASSRRSRRRHRRRR